MVALCEWIMNENEELRKEHAKLSKENAKMQTRLEKPG